MSPELKAAVERALERYDAMTPEQKADHGRQQRESFMRGFGPCEHGNYDWETCSQCLDQIYSKRRHP